jgi:hypothetical protein
MIEESTQGVEESTESNDTENESSSADGGVGTHPKKGRGSKTKEETPPPSTGG